MNQGPTITTTAGQTLPRRLFFYNLGFLRERRLRRILALMGFELRLGMPGPEDGVVVWGRSPHAARGEAVAARRCVPLVRVEDGFLRSLRPGRSGEPGLGFMVDGGGVHFDAGTPSALERILAKDPLDDAQLLTRARDGIARMRALHLSKYNAHPVPGPVPEPGYVLVVDQTRGDASIRHGGTTAASFGEMLALAVEENPGQRVVIKAHPETTFGLRPGHFTADDAHGQVSLLAGPVSPWALLEGATAVYTVTSQLGFEAILAGHRPVVFGQPFYAGWGLTDDRNPIARRQRNLTKAQLFAGAMILAPSWYDPCRDRLGRFEEAVDQLEAEVRALRDDAAGHVATGMRLWKRRRLQDFFGREKPILFQNNSTAAARLAKKTGRHLLTWGSGAPGLPDTQRVEDGFLRSRGLGAELVPALSLVRDDLGIYYDATRESRLERLILSPPPPGGLARAEALRESLIASRVTKYNLATRPLPEAFPQAISSGHRILVPGQVEDDAAIRLATGAVATNLALLRAARAANPGAVILYKPHPDVEAGLRPGAVAEPDLAGLADFVAHAADPVALIDTVDEVWTMTSLLGFEALIRGKPVTTLGAPFYAGWGLTRDLGEIPARRHNAPDGHPLPRPGLAQLIHATLIAYPRYYDPLTRRPCPPEVAVERLAQGAIPRPGMTLRLLAKFQGTLASRSWLWRRR